MKESFLIYSHIKNLLDNGNQNSISDSGVACLCVYACIHGAYLNVRINLKEIEMDQGIMKEAIEILKKSKIEKEKILRLIDQKI